MARMTAATRADAATRTGIAGNVGRTTTGVSNAPVNRGRRPEASVSRAGPGRVDTDRVINSHAAGTTSATIERSGRIERSSTQGEVIEQRGFGRQATGRAYHPPSAQGGASSVPAGGNRVVTVPKPGISGRGESVSAPKAQNGNGVLGGQRSVDSAFSREGAAGGAGGSRMGGWSGGGGNAFSRGGPGGHFGGGAGGGSFHRAR